MHCNKTTTAEDAEEMPPSALVVKDTGPRSAQVRPFGFFLALSFLLFLFSAVLSGCKRERLPDYPPAYREYAYVTNGGSNSVTVTYKNGVVTKIDRGKAAGGMRKKTTVTTR